MVPSDSNEEARRKLNREIERLTFTDIDFRDVVQFLREYSDVNIHANWRALQVAGIEPCTKVSLDVRRITAKRVLDLILRDISGAAAGPEAEVAYVLDEGVVTVSTRADLANALERPVSYEFLAPSEEEPISPAPSLGEWVGHSRATLAIVFADIVSSVKLESQLGNRAMTPLRFRHFNQAARLARTHGGYLVSTAGDAVLAVFRVASDALGFALALRADPGDQRIQVRLGIHVGPVDVAQGSAYGATVDYARRVVDEAPGGEIWLSDEAKRHVVQERAAHHEALQWGCHSDLKLKGFPGAHALWSIAPE